MGPGLTENIPAEAQVAKNAHYTIHVGSYNLSKRIQEEATGFKMLTMSIYNLYNVLTHLALDLLSTILNMKLFSHLPL